MEIAWRRRLPQPARIRANVVPSVSLLILRGSPPVPQFFDMSSRNASEICPLCKRGNIVGEDRQLAFRQKTDKGHVFCRVTISMNICKACGLTSWGDTAEAIIEDAVREQYAKLA